MTVQNVSSSDGDELPVGASVALATLTYGGASVGIVGNAVVMLAIVCTVTMRRSTADLLVFNLALADILVCSVAMPVLGTYFTFQWPDWTMGNATCKMAAYVVNVCSLISVSTLVVIAVERYFAIVNSRHLLGRRSLGFLLIAIWCGSAVLLVYPLVDGGVAMETVGKGNHRICNKMSGNELNNASFRRSLILKLVLGLGVQVVLFALYARMGCTMWRWRNVPSAESSTSIAVRKNRQVKQRACVMMFTVVVLFCVCWLPFWTTTCLRLRPPYHGYEVPPSAVLLTYCVAMLNSAVNPVVYALLSMKYRRAYTCVLYKCLTCLPTRCRTMTWHRNSSGAFVLPKQRTQSSNSGDATPSAVYIFRNRNDSSLAI